MQMLAYYTNVSPPCLSNLPRLYKPLHRNTPKRSDLDLFRTSRAKIPLCYTPQKDLAAFEVSLLAPPLPMLFLWYVKHAVSSEGSLRPLPEQARCDTLMRAQARRLIA